MRLSVHPNNISVSQFSVTVSENTLFTSAVKHDNNDLLSKGCVQTFLFKALLIQFHILHLSLLILFVPFEG